MTNLTNNQQLPSTQTLNPDSNSSQLLPNPSSSSSSSHPQPQPPHPPPRPSQDPYHSRPRPNHFPLPGPNSLLAGLPPPYYHPLDSPPATPLDSFQDQFSRLSEPDRHQFRLTARQFSNEIRDIQNITDQVIRDSTRDSIPFNNSLFLTRQPFEGLRRFREQMDRVYTPVNFDIAYPSESSSIQSNFSAPTSTSFIEEPARGIRHGSPVTVHRIRPSGLQPASLGINNQTAATPYPTNNPSTDGHPPNDPIHQNRTHEFVDHSARLRLNRRPRLSPVPSSSSDHDITESLESFRRCGERLKRVFNSSRLNSNESNSTGTTDAEPREPTTAELAEAAARASNEHHALPAFYSPDASLKVTKVVIPVDTNPMERRKIIFEASKDGSIRWKDADQKATYERSKDGLVGEEIGEIEFHYVCLPKKKKQASNSLSSLGGGPDRSVRPSSFSLARPSNQSSTDRAIGDAFERINEARTQETRSTRDHQYTYHPNRYQFYQRPRYRLVAASRRHVPLNRDLAFELPNLHSHWSSSNRETNRSSSRPTTYETLSSSNHNNNNNHSSSRLTRRPISWSERFYSATSDHYRPISSSNHHHPQDQERDRNDDDRAESEGEENSIDDPDFLQSPPLDIGYSVHF